jgi:hypothetical protein
MATFYKDKQEQEAGMSGDSREESANSRKVPDRPTFGKATTGYDQFLASSPVNERSACGDSGRES